MNPQRERIAVEVRPVDAPDGADMPMVLLQLPNGYAVVPAEAALRIAEELIAAAAATHTRGNHE